jgi:hypothetical protein
VEPGTIVHCGKCSERIVVGKDLGYVCFKLPVKEGCQFFHRRFRSGDCWEIYLKQRKEKLNS